MTLNSANSPPCSVKNHTIELEKDTCIMKDTVLLENTSEVKQVVEKDSMSRGGSGDISTESNYNAISLNGAIESCENHKVVEKKSSDHIGDGMVSNHDDKCLSNAASCDDVVLSPSIPTTTSSIPSPHSHSNKGVTSQCDHQASNCSSSSITENEKPVEPPITVNQDSSDSNTNSQVDTDDNNVKSSSSITTDVSDSSSLTVSKENDTSSPSPKQNDVVDNILASSPSASLTKDNDNNHSISISNDQTSPTVEGISCTDNVVTEREPVTEPSPVHTPSPVPEPSPVNKPSPQHTPNPSSASTIESRSENHLSSDQSAWEECLVEDTEMEADMDVDKDQLVIDITQPELDVSSNVSPSMSCKGKDGSRISLLEFPPVQSPPGKDTNSSQSQPLSPTRGVDKDTTNTSEEVMRVEMEVEEDTSPVVKDVEEASGDLDLACTTSSSVETAEEDLKDEEKLTNGDGIMIIDKDVSEDVDNDISAVGSLLIESVQGAKDVDSVRNEEHDADNEIKLVSVCSTAVDMDEGDVVNTNTDCLDTDTATPDGKVELEGVVMDEGDVVNTNTDCVDTDTATPDGNVELEGVVMDEEEDQKLDAADEMDQKELDSNKVMTADDGGNAIPATGTPDDSLEMIPDTASPRPVDITVTPPSPPVDPECDKATAEETVNNKTTEKEISSSSNVDSCQSNVDLNDSEMGGSDKDVIPACDKNNEESEDVDMDTDDLHTGNAGKEHGGMNISHIASEANQEEKEVKSVEEEEKDCSKVENVNEDVKKSIVITPESDDLKLEDSKSIATEVKIDKVEDGKQKEESAGGDSCSVVKDTGGNDPKKHSFKNILKCDKEEKIEKQQSPQMNISGEDDIIILDENDEDLNLPATKSKSNTPPLTVVNENVNNDAKANGSNSESKNKSKPEDEVARKRSMSSDDIVNPSSPKKTRLDSDTKGASDSVNPKSPEVTVVLMDSDKEEEDETKTDTDKSGIALTSKALRGLILGSIKAAIWSHKLEKTVQLEERMSKMEAASSLWKESSKHLEKSVEELSRFSKEIERRRIQSGKLQHMSNRSVGVQVTPIIADKPSSNRQSIQQVKPASQPLPPPKAPPTSTTSASPQHQQPQHRLPPSVLLNHNATGQKPVSVSPSSTTPTTSAKVRTRQNLPAQQQQQQPQIRPGGPPATQYNSNQQRSRVRNLNPSNLAYSPQNPPTNNYQARPPGVNPSANQMPRPGQPRQPSPAINSNNNPAGGVIDLTDEDEPAKRFPSANNRKLYNNPPPPTNNNINRSNVAFMGAAPSQQQTQHQQLLQQQQLTGNNRVPPLQQHSSNNHLQQRNNVMSSTSVSTTNQRPGVSYNNSAPRPGGTTTGGVCGGGKSRQGKNATLPPSSSLNNKQHPASFPVEANNLVVPHSAKLPPPRPSLKISRVLKGIVLSWNMPSLDKCEVIASYQLFAYQESTGMPSPAAWKKVGDVKALPLPMACTLTQFQECNKYYFAVRAVDQHGRWGEYSEPSSIYLNPEGHATNGADS